MGKIIGAEEILAQYSASLKYADIPSEARESAKRSILDTLGVTMAASKLGSGHKELIELIKEARGKKDSTILGFGGKVPAWMAAFGNGAMARAINFDDVHDETMTHPSSVVVPAAFAVAERVGKVSGKDLITSVTIGNEIICRMGLSISQRPKGLKMEKWFPTSVYGVFGGAAACCHLLGLDVIKTRHAFGIAFFESSGTLEAFSASGQSSMMRGMITGFTAKSAVISSLMAEKGITGVPDSLKGKCGFYNVYFDGDYNLESMIDNIGQRFLFVDIAIKPWPTGRYTHSYIDGVLQLVGEHDIQSEDIKEIRIYVAGFVQTTCEPLDKQRGPTNFNHAGNALPYLVAAAVVRRRIMIEDLISGLKDPRVLQMAQKVIHQFDARFNIENKMGPSLVEINLNNGKSYSKQLEICYGHPQNPMSWNDLANKFRDCISYSKRVLSKEKTERVIDMIRHLDEIDDINQMILHLG